MKKLNLFIKSLIVIAILSIIIAVSFVSFDFLNTRRRFPPHSYIGKINVSGLNQQESIKKLTEVPIEYLFEPMVYFVTTGESFAYTPREVGIFVKAKETVNQAFSLTRKDNYLKELKKRLAQKRRIHPIILGADEFQLEEIVMEIASRVESIPKDATVELDEKTGAYTISEDLPGRRLNVYETIKQCEARLSTAKNTFPLILDYYEFARITESALRSAPPVHKLASYTTYYGKHDSPNRIHNIRLIASWLNNTILLQDEEFSLLKATGNFTPDRGYKEAYVIVGDALEPQYGGGTCQIATTFYNSLALADIEILSRRNHSLYFNIYPFGRDATLYPGNADFKFKNDTAGPILIKTKVTRRSLTFSVYGTPHGKKVKFSKPEVFILSTKGFIPSTRYQALKGNSPFRTIVTRFVYDKEGNLIKKEKVKSYYKLYGDGSNVKIIRKEPR